MGKLETIKDVIKDMKDLIQFITKNCFHANYSEYTRDSIKKYIKILKKYQKENECKKDDGQEGICGCKYCRQQLQMLQLISISEAYKENNKKLLKSLEELTKSTNG